MGISLVVPGECYFCHKNPIANQRIKLCEKCFKEAQFRFSYEQSDKEQLLHVTFSRPIPKKQSI